MAKGHVNEAEKLVSIFIDVVVKEVDEQIVD